MANSPKIKVNQVVVSGYVPRDAWVNESKTFLSFTVGYDKSYKSQKGDWVNQVAWIPVKLWAKEDRIALLADKIKKGCSAIVTGQMDQSSYKGKDGESVINEVFLRADRIQVYATADGSESTDSVDTGSYESDPNFVPNSDETGNLNFNFLENQQ